MPNLTSVLNQLTEERAGLQLQLERLNSALSVLGATNMAGRKRTLSAAARSRIAAAQRARWAKVKNRKAVTIIPRKRRKMSAAAIARIRAAQKARWAKWKRKHRAG